MDIKEFGRSRQFELDTESLSTIRCSSPTFKMLISIEKDLNTGSTDNPSFMRKLIRRVSQRIHENASEDTETVEDISLTDADVNNLSNEEIENFAHKFLTHNKWLLEEYESSKTTNEKGEIRLSMERSPVDFPKEDGEYDSDYLVRVLRRYFDEQTKRNKLLKQTLNPFSNFLKSPFLDSVNELMNKHHFLSNQLKSKIRTFDDSVNPPQLKSLEIPVSTNSIHETNILLGDVLNRVDEVQEVIFRSAELIQNMSEIALKMQTAFEQSSRRSMLFSLVMISIAAVSLLFTMFFSWSDHKQSSSQEELFRHYLSNQEAFIENLTQQQARQHRQLIDSLEEKIESLAEQQDNQINHLPESLPSINKSQSENDR